MASLPVIDRRQSNWLRRLSFSDFDAVLGGLSGKRVLVLGSAPNPEFPPDLDGSWKLVCVNGSVISAKQLGLQDPTVTLMTSAVFGSDDNTSQNTRSNLQGLNLGQLIVTLSTKKHSSPHQPCILDVSDIESDFSAA
ncbi:MAG: hypothetical protein KF769_16065 [Parvibaculum sp.]|nr:hypothetical protein [Parvibaculum sp.]